MQICLFCKSGGPFSTIEHIVPESLGNKHALLEGHVCDKCQNYFGRNVERYVLSNTFIGWWRTYLGVGTKGGRRPEVDLSRTEKQFKGLPDVDGLHDNVSFAAQEDGPVLFKHTDPTKHQALAEGSKTHFEFVLTPEDIQMIGRFLIKMGLEYLCSIDPDRAKSDAFSAARLYAREGNVNLIWPMYKFSVGSIAELRKIDEYDDRVEIETDCWECSLFDAGQALLIFHFRIGTSHYVICLTDPNPRPEIQAEFPGVKMALVYYDKSQWKNGRFIVSE